VFRKIYSIQREGRSSGFLHDFFVPQTTSFVNQDVYLYCIRLRQLAFCRVTALWKKIRSRRRQAISGWFSLLVRGMVLYAGKARPLGVNDVALP